MQYQKLYIVLKQSALVQSTEISPDIIRELAEWATGEWQKCVNRGCKEEGGISVLHEDVEIFNKHVFINIT